MAYCSYYQAHVPPQTCWLFVALLRSYEHVAFDRTLDTQGSIFEFFVPQSTEELFLQIMHELGKQDLVADLTKLPNRLCVQKTL